MTAPFREELVRQKLYLSALLKPRGVGPPNSSRLKPWFKELSVRNERYTGELESFKLAE
jgi:hypothetical protein